MKKKETIKYIIQLIVAILTAILTTLGVESCLQEPTPTPSRGEWSLVSPTVSSVSTNGGNETLLNHETAKNQW